MNARSPVTPARVGRFELRRELGKGAQATVWLGFDARLEREVAVKLLRSGADTAPDDVTHWLQEARSVSRLTHPNIVPVFEADVQDGRPYLVFEYVPGRTLSEHLKARGALPPPEALSLMLGVLDALQTAHTAGVVHRDLKPSNILVDGSGRARVMTSASLPACRKASGRPASRWWWARPATCHPRPRAARRHRRRWTCSRPVCCSSSCSVAGGCSSSAIRCGPCSAWPPKTLRCRLT